jgi:hypothetical protein
LHARLERERSLVELELAGLDLGEIEYLVDKSEQRARRLVDGARVRLLLGGVRISWLMAARKRDLARFAASA